MIHARSETLHEKPSFKGLIRRNRVILPADAYYEDAPEKKMLMRISLKDTPFFAMAALYDDWVHPDGSRLKTCTMVTTSPNSLVQDYDDRMPVILRRDDAQKWLDHTQDIEQVLGMLKPFPPEEMQMKVVPVDEVRAIGRR